MWVAVTAVGYVALVAIGGLVGGDGWAVGVMIGGAVPAGACGLVHFIQTEDLAPQPWSERLYQLGQVWEDGAVRIWIIWGIAVIAFPWSVVTLPGASDYGELAGRGLAVLVTGSVSWFGLKVLDARVARRLQEGVGGQGPGGPDEEE